MAKYRVLSIDGGGIRGLITTVMMQRLAARPGLDEVDPNPWSWISRCRRSKGRFVS